jgi:uncharacterized alkaline shock family protein YloU
MTGGDPMPDSESIRPAPEEPVVSGEPEAAHRDHVDDNGVRGTISVAPAVLVELIELTLRDIDGFVGFSRSRRKGRGQVVQIQGAEVAETAGKTYQRGGVQVRIDGSRIDADLSIIVRSGSDVPGLGRAIQQRVGLAVERMLAMTANEVNIHVVEVQPAETEHDEMAT